jgi:hypothetical protein
MEIKTTNDIKELRNPHWFDDSEEGERLSLKFNETKWIQVEQLKERIVVLENALLNNINHQDIKKSIELFKKYTINQNIQN